MTTVSIKVSGVESVQQGLNDAIRALSPRAMSGNFRKIMKFARDEVAAKTPGKNLKNGWEHEAKFKTTADGGFQFRGRVFNRFAGQRLYYQAAVSGLIKAKRNANDTHQTYADIIPFLDEGTKPHRIFPRRYKNLVFRSSKSPPPGDPDISNVVFTKGVSHPGTKAYGMLTQTRGKLENLARTAVFDVRDQVIRAFGQNRIGT